MSVKYNEEIYYYAKITYFFTVITNTFVKIKELLAERKMRNKDAWGEAKW